MATKKDFYEVLGLTKGATLEDIKKAYRTLARKHHPDIDKSPGAAERFKEVSEAYQVLSDSEKRKAYDQFGHAAFDRAGSGAGGFGGGNPFGGGYRTYTYTTGGGPEGFDFGNFQDPFSLFEQFFSGASSGRARQKSGGDDLYFELTIDFKEAIFGATKTITFEKQTLCPICLGKGSKRGEDPKTCPTCKGSGHVERSAGQSIFGMPITQWVTCPTCHSVGVLNPCDKCHGAGRLRESVKTEIKIPGGVDSGDTIRFANMGDIGPRGSTAGDLYLTVRVVQSSEFRRRGNDIYSETKIDLPTAVLGGTVEVPTLQDPVKLKIPAGTQGGTEFRLRGLGVPGQGDQFVRVQLETPTRLSREERDLWQRLQQP